MIRKLILTLAVVCLLMAAPVFAQTAEPQPEATAALEAPTPLPTVAEQPSGTSVPSLVIMLVGSFLVGGVAVGAPLMVIITGMTKTQKDTIEKLYLSQPPETQKKERAIIDLADKVIGYLGAVLKVANEVTDGLPNVEPPATVQNVNSSDDGIAVTITGELKHNPEANG